ncbi:MAG: pyridoxal-dependent decarboxylase, partial [Polyangiales bacterium]
MQVTSAPVHSGADPVPPELPDMSSAEFAHWAHHAVDWVAGYLQNNRDYPVLSRAKPGEILAALAEVPPEKGRPFAELWHEFQQHILPGITHWNHPRFFAYFSITASAPGILGELLCAALNVNAMLWKTSPAATELEQRVLDWLRQMLRLPQSFEGVIVDTASVASLLALAAAR